MSEKPHPGRWERHPPGRGGGGALGTDSAVFATTVGMILLIPALVSVGPVGAAILLRQHNGAAAVGAALLVATVATGVALIVGASLAFAVARRRSRHGRTPLMRVRNGSVNGLRGNGIRVNRRRVT